MTTATRFTAEHAEARSRIINAAVAEGKFPESRRSRYEALFDSAPKYASDLIAQLAPGLPPAALGVGAPEPDVSHRSFLSASERERIVRAERGEQLVHVAHD